MRKNKGFTLIELLVVIGIVGLLSTLAVTALNGARAKSRDARRVANIKAIQTALELYFQDAGGYPSVATLPTTLAVGGAVYMGVVPTNPGPNGATYTYACLDSNPCGGSYTITFNLESGTGSLASGNHTATVLGMQ